MKTTTGLMPLLRALGVAGLAQLKAAGVAALVGALRAKLAEKKADILADALARLQRDGDVAKLGTPGPYTDRDGVEMNGNQMFVHQALFAIPRAVAGGTVADVLRDDHFASWGLAEADTLLAGVTDGAAALEIVFDRLREQF